MTKEQADELIRDWCNHSNDCSYNCHICPIYKKLLNTELEEDF